MTATEDEDFARIRRRVTAVRAHCIRLQRLEEQREGAGVAGLREMADPEHPECELFSELCELLFRVRGDRPNELWRPGWDLVGGARVAGHPLAPYHVFQGVPFDISIGIRGYMMEALPADRYLAAFLEAGTWHREPYRDLCGDQLRAAAAGLADRGPWSRPLRPVERDLLLAQVPGGASDRPAGPVLALDDISGAPLRPPAFDSRWRSADVLGLARAITEDEKFDRLPILADALMDAGCDDEDILAHCRSDGPHVRGCWVVDLVLGKE